MTRLSVSKEIWLWVLVIAVFLCMSIPFRVSGQDKGTTPPSSAAAAEAKPSDNSSGDNSAAGQSQTATAQNQTVTMEIAAPAKAVSSVDESPGSVQQISDKRDKVLVALLQKEFSYVPENMVDPFVPFIVQREEPLSQVASGDDEGPAQPQMPQTPLQKMALGQIERGFKAVLWGELGMRALIEDDAGKGYIVSVGTPVGGDNGVVTDILNDRLVILQKVWDRDVKQWVPRSVEVKLAKTATSNG